MFTLLIYASLLLQLAFDPEICVDQSAFLPVIGHLIVVFAVRKIYRVALDGVRALDGYSGIFLTHQFEGIYDARTEGHDVGSFVLDCGLHCALAGTDDGA